MRASFKTSNGFTFVELCIVVMIMGILIAGFLAGYMVYAQKQRYEITRERTAALQYALESYALANKRLPCPADPTIPLMSAGVGKEVDCAVGATAPAGIQKTGTGATEIWRGAVPTNVLRVGSEGATDGWGNRFAYVVSRKLTEPNGQLPNATTGERPFGVIKVVDVSGSSILDTDKLARFLLISSGPTGMGAYTQQGVQRAVPRNSKEAENYDDNETFVMAALTRKDGSGFYDDVLIHDESIKANPDLADRVLYCNGKQLFFAPEKPGADADGCLGNNSNDVLREITEKIASCAGSAKIYNPKDSTADADGCAWPVGQVLGFCAGGSTGGGAFEGGVLPTTPTWNNDAPVWSLTTHQGRMSLTSRSPTAYYPSSIGPSQLKLRGMSAYYNAGPCQCPSGLIPVTTGCLRPTPPALQLNSRVYTQVMQNLQSVSIYFGSVAKF